MALVNNAEVQALVNDTVTDCTQYITTAHLIVTEDLGTSGLTSDRLKQIELYLAAHFYTISIEKGGLLKYTVGDSTDEYQGVSKGSQGLALTHFGTQAAVLDTSGTLSLMASNPVRAQFRVV